MWPHYVQVEVGVKKIDIHLVCNVLWVSGSHTVGVGAVLTGGPALCGSGLLQLYQSPHHGRQGTGCLSTTGLPLGDTLLLVSGLRQRLFTLWRRRTPAEKISVNRRKSSINLGEKMIHNNKKNKNLPPASTSWRGVHRASSSWWLILVKTWLVCLKEWWFSAAVWLISWRTWWLPAGDVWLCLTFTGWHQQVRMVEKTADMLKGNLHLGILNCSQKSIVNVFFIIYKSIFKKKKSILRKIRKACTYSIA